MRRFIPALALGLSIVSLPVGAEAPKPSTPNDIIAAAPATDWVRIAPADLMVMDLAPDASGKARRVVIQLMPAPFSQGWVGNIRKLVAAHWFDGIAVVRAQDNYVVQWGDPDGETEGKAKPLPAGLRTVSEVEYVAPASSLHGSYFTKQFSDLRSVVGLLAQMKNTNTFDPAKLRGRDPYALVTGMEAGWPLAADSIHAWPVHCYGMVGVGRNTSPDTGTGAELYTVIGQAPRQLDRNIALVGRVIAGMENLSSLPRGTGDLGFYKTPQERTPIVAVRLGSEVAGLPAYEYLSTESGSFAAYVDKRANRKDDFYIQPAGGVDVCNAPVPIREAKG